MKLNLPSNILPFSRRAGSLLVCETDGFTLKAAVLSRAGEQLTASFAAQSRAQDFKQAVAEVVASLKKQGWSGRGRAVLLMPGVIAALVELPVPPNKPRPPLQMQELVRWELEPLLMQHTTIWSIGRILVGLGYLEESQAREVLARQQGKFQGKEGEVKLEMYSLKRFGDVAIEHGYITREQLDEALAKQAWLRMEGDDIACGWQSVAAEQAGEGPYPWLAAGVNKGLLKQWENAFAAQRMTLEYLFPVAGCAAAILPPHEPAILLEAGGGQVLGIRLGEQGIEAMVSHESALNGTMEACLETYHGLTPPDPESLWLAVGEAGESDLATALSAIVGRTVRPLEPGMAGVADSVSAGMAGAARQVFGLPGGAHCCAVPVRGPRVPLRSLPQFRLAAGGLLVLSGILLAEGVLQVRQSLAEDAAGRVNKQAAEIDGAVARVQALIQQKESIKARRAEAEAMATRAIFYTDELPHRAALLRNLLNEMENAVSDSLVLDRVVEEPRKGIVIDAWALRDAAAQQFALALKRNLDSLGLTVVDVRVSEKNGRLSLPGYGLTMRIVDKAVAAHQAGAATAQPAGRGR